MGANTNQIKSVFYTIDAHPLQQLSKKPHHLEKRFQQSSSISYVDKAKQAELRRDAIMDQRRYLANQKFLRAKRIAREVRCRRENTMKNVADRVEQETIVVPKKKPSAWSLLLADFRDLKLPLPSSQETWLDFSELSQLLNQAKVIVVSSKILSTALKIVDDRSKSRARILLTSYMMLMCPLEVLETIDGDEEKSLHHAAKEMLDLFEVWLAAHGRPGATKARLAFVDAWSKYYTLFETWKSNDSSHLIDDLIAYYMELSALRQTVIDKNHGDESVGEQLKQQLEQLQTKIERIGGKDASDRLRQVQNSSNRSVQESEESRSPPLEAEKENCAKKEVKDVEQLLNGYTNPSSGLTNEQLAHELILDPDFKLEKYEPKSSLEKQVKLIAEKAFFDKIADDIKKENSEASLLSLIGEIKTRLLRIVRLGTLTHDSIMEGLDLDLIKQQMKSKSFDMKKMIRYVFDICSSICAPIRDNEINRARGMDTMEQLKQIFHLIENMSRDLANFRLRSLRPHLMSMSEEYERGRFAELLEMNQLQLTRTEAWLNKSANELCHLAAQRNPECIQPETNNRPSHDSVFEHAMIDLLGQSKILSHFDDLPETFGLDVKRMATFQNEIQAITIVAALLLLSRNFGASNSESRSTLATTLFIMLEGDEITIDHLVAEIMRSANISTDKQHMVKGIVDKTMSHNDTVYSLISRRVLSVIKSTIHHQKFVSNAVLASNGLEHVKSNLESLSIRIQRLVYHNKKVYSTWYDEMIKNAIDTHIILEKPVIN